MMGIFTRGPEILIAVTSFANIANFTARKRTERAETKKKEEDASHSHSGGLYSNVALQPNGPLISKK